VRGISRIKRALLRLTDPQRFVERMEEQQLERMMGFPGQYQSHRVFQVALLKRLGLTPRKRLLEIGCGPLTLGVPIIAFLEKGNYCGIDVRPSVLNAAYRLISNNELADKNPRFIYSKSFGRDELAQEIFDWIVSFSVLYHLEDNLVGDLFTAVSNRLTLGGVYLANVNVEHAPSRWLEFPFVQRPISYYQECAQRVGLVAQILGRGEDFGMTKNDIASQNYLLSFRKVQGVSSGEPCPDSTVHQESADTQWVESHTRHSSRPRHGRAADIRSWNSSFGIARRFS
jgi:SAM-dependent methyltransferase